MQAGRFIAERLRFKGKMAVAATAISFFVITIALAVSGGFRQAIRDGLSEMYGDIVLSGDPLTASDSTISLILGSTGVRDAVPVIRRPGIAKSRNGLMGIVFKGVPSMDSSMMARIPSSMASRLSLNEGDDFTAYFVDDRMKVRRFIVDGIFESPVETDGAMTVLVPIEDMRRVNGWSEQEVSDIEILLEDRDIDRELLFYLTSSLGYRTNSDSYAVREKYSRIFDWLDLLDFNVLAILILMTAVAGFNMISGLYILLFRNISTIGILKSMGMSNYSVGMVFLRLAARIVATGMVVGTVAALLFCLIQSSTHVIGLDPVSYFISYVPVHLNPLFVLAADAISFAVIMILLLIPTLFIAKVDPAQTAKSE